MFARFVTHGDEPVWINSALVTHIQQMGTTTNSKNKIVPVSEIRFGTVAVTVVSSPENIIAQLERSPNA